MALTILVKSFSSFLGEGKTLLLLCSRRQVETSLKKHLGGEKDRQTFVCYQHRDIERETAKENDLETAAY